MKKTNIFLAAALLLTFAACKDDKTTPTPTVSRHDMVVGTWNFRELGDDANNNMVLDAGEATSVDSLGISGTVTFRNDGTATAYTTFFGSTDTSSFTWSLTNSDNTLHTIDGATGDVSDALITDLTSSRFVYLEPTTPPGGAGNFVVLGK